MFLLPVAKHHTTAEHQQSFEQCRNFERYPQGLRLKSVDCFKRTTLLTRLAEAGQMFLSETLG